VERVALQRRDGRSNFRVGEKIRARVIDRRTGRQLANKIFVSLVPNRLGGIETYFDVGGKDVQISSYPEGPRRSRESKGKWR
jgi:DNA-directed RNA polymerase subunit E'/Rpb7